MIQRNSPSAILALLALGSIVTRGGREYHPASQGRFIGGGSSTRKPKSNRRKNPFRGTTYARIIGVSSHV